MIKKVAILLICIFINLYSIQPVSDYNSYGYFIKMLQSSSEFIKYIKTLNQKVNQMQKEIFDTDLSFYYQDLFSSNLINLTKDIEVSREYAQLCAKDISSVSSHKVNINHNQLIKRKQIDKAKQMEKFLEDYNKTLKVLNEFDEKVKNSKSIHEDIVINNKLLLLLITENIKSNLALKQATSLFANWIDESGLSG